MLAVLAPSGLSAYPLFKRSGGSQTMQARLPGWRVCCSQPCRDTDPAFCVDRSDNRLQQIVLDKNPESSRNS
eukprot:COSAG01_NODE_7111_length_3346_cov_78.626116_1_plen_72_part_00